MSVLWRLKYLYLTLAMLSPVNVETQASRESSGEYLQKVMIELQELNVPSSANAYDRLSSNADYKNTIYENKDQQSHVVQRINSNARPKVQKHRNQGLQRYTISQTDKVDLNEADSEIVPQYYQTQVPTVTKMREPELLGFTRTELAAMYKNALEKGSAISLSSLTNALASGDMPQVSQTHLEFPVKQPLYHYYFFPLKTFMSEFKKDHGYKTIPASTLENTEAAETTQTQLSNPLFVAISTFITMAIIFMMGIMFLPKLTQYDILHARGIQDDFVYLSNIVMNAIDRYNLLEKFEEHRSDPSRYNVTTKIKNKGAKRITTAIVNRKIKRVP